MIDVWRKEAMIMSKKWRIFTVSIYEKPLVYTIEAQNKKDAQNEAIFKYSHQGNTQNVHKIKVRNGGDE